MASDAAEQTTTTETETPAPAKRRSRRGDVRPASFGAAADTAASDAAGAELGIGPAEPDDAEPLTGTVDDEKPKRRRDTRTGDRHKPRPGKAVQEGAAVVYTLAGTTVQMVGLHFAGYAMQAQADKAGPTLAKWAMTHERAKRLFESVGTGSEMAPLIAGPIIAESYVRFEGLRPRLAPLLALLLPEDAASTIVELFPPPGLPIGAAAEPEPAGVSDVGPADSPPATVAVDDVPPPPAEPEPAREQPAAKSKRRARVGSATTGETGAAA